MAKEDTYIDAQVLRLVVQNEQKLLSPRLFTWGGGNVLPQAVRLPHSLTPSKSRKSQVGASWMSAPTAHSPCLPRAKARWAGARALSSHSRNRHPWLARGSICAQLMLHEDPLRPSLPQAGWTTGARLSNFLYLWPLSMCKLEGQKLQWDFRNRCRWSALTQIRAGVCGTRPRPAWSAASPSAQDWEYSEGRLQVGGMERQPEKQNSTGGQKSVPKPPE